jgi:hypothetical protein
MDLRLYLRVLRRFWPITIVGLMLAVGLAFLAYVRVDYSQGKVDLTYRASEQWVAYTTLMISRDGFPWGSAGVPNAQVIPSTVPPPSTSKSEDKDSGAEPDPGDTYADPSWFSQLAVLYARMADSDPVRQMIEAEAPIGSGKVLADAVISGPNNSVVLPMVSIAGFESTQQGAQDLSNRAAAALKKYIEDQQVASNIPDDQRVQIDVVAEPVRAELFKGRPMTAPILVFALGVIGTIGLVFLLENLRPRRVPLGTAPPPTYDGSPPLPPVPGGPSSGDHRGRTLPRRVSVAGAAGALAEGPEPAGIAPTPLPPRSGDLRADAPNPRRVTRVTGGPALTNGHGTPDVQASGNGLANGNGNGGAAAEPADATAAAAPRTRPGRSWLWAR